MAEEELRKRLAQNLAHYRRQAGMTQAELSERINYSDKSVSKWERGEGLPDVYVMTQLADIFEISVNDLLSETKPRRHAGSVRVHFLITLMAVGLVWLCATIVYFFGKIFLPNASSFWMAYIFAIPVSGVVLTVFTALWWKLIYQGISVSLIVWGVAITVHLGLGRFIGTIYLIYLVAAVMQVLIGLWYWLVAIKKTSGVPSDGK